MPRLITSTSSGYSLQNCFALRHEQAQRTRRSWPDSKLMTKILHVDVTRLSSVGISHPLIGWLYIFRVYVRFLLPPAMCAPERHRRLEELGIPLEIDVCQPRRSTLRTGANPKTVRAYSIRVWKSNRPATQAGFVYRSRNATTRRKPAKEPRRFTEIQPYNEHVPSGSKPPRSAGQRNTQASEDRFAIRAGRRPGSLPGLARRLQVEGGRHSH